MSLLQGKNDNFVRVRVMMCQKKRGITYLITFFYRLTKEVSVSGRIKLDKRVVCFNLI